MTSEPLSEMHLDCLARVLRRLCEAANLDADDVFEDAALETTGNFDCKEKAGELLSSLRLA